MEHSTLVQKRLTFGLWKEVKARQGKSGGSRWRNQKGKFRVDRCGAGAREAVPRMIGRQWHGTSDGNAGRDAVPDGPVSPSFRMYRDWASSVGHCSMCSRPAVSYRSPPLPHWCCCCHPPSGLVAFLGSRPQHRLRYGAASVSAVRLHHLNYLNCLSFARVSAGISGSSSTSRSSVTGRA
jgi:hypothetical protein